MFMKNRSSRIERRSLILGTLLFLGGATGVFNFLRDDSLQADGARPARRPRPEVKLAAGTDEAAAEFEEKMEAAMDAAYEKLDDFIAVVSKPQATQEQFAVKFLLQEGDEGEYVWINEVKFAEKEFSGKLANRPEVSKKLKLGDSVKIKEEDVVDWMYVDNGKLKGGYTIRAQREYYQGDARQAFDKQFKFKFE